MNILEIVITAILSALLTAGLMHFPIRFLIHTCNFTIKINTLLAYHIARIEGDKEWVQRFKDNLKYDADNETNSTN